jgi:hypothetical protein
LNNDYVRSAVSNEQLKENTSRGREISNKEVLLQGYVTEANEDYNVKHVQVESVAESCKTLAQLAVPEAVYNDVAKEQDLNLAYISDSIPNVISRKQEERDSETVSRVNHPYTEAVFSWESMSSQICRLCACTNELYPKQSIVGWLGILNEILPGVVSMFIVSA